MEVTVWRTEQRLPVPPSRRPCRYWFQPFRFCVNQTWPTASIRITKVVVNASFGYIMVCLLKEDNVKPVLLFSAVSLILLSVSFNSVLAKCATLGIYAIVDQVTFEPNERSPEFIRISGLFVVPVRLSSGAYHQPKKGYLYFRIRPEREEAIRKDWAQLKHFAGTGEVVAFAEYWVPNPNDPQGNPHHSLEVTVHAEGESSPTPDIYPIPLPGVIKAEAIVHNPKNAENDCNADKIVEQLQEAWRH